MNWKTIFKSLKNRDMLKRILAVLGVIVVYRLLAHIPIPLAEPTQLKEVVTSVINSNNLTGFLNLVSGGMLDSFSIILLGLSPYITVSIIIQLLTKAIPKLEELHKDGESGRRKINQWTRMAVVPLAIVQSIVYIYMLRQSVLTSNVTVLSDLDFMGWFIAVSAMTAGSIILMWLGEIMTEQGIGNGISLIIFAGIASRIPKIIGTVGASLIDTSNGSLNVFNWFTIPVDPTTFWIVVSLIALSIILLYALVKINEAQRILVINYAKRVHGNSNYGGITSILPIKMIIANVIPIIFAVAFLSIPSFIGQVINATGSERFANLATTLTTWFQTPSSENFTGSGFEIFIYPITYFILVILFTYFYTSIVFNSNEIAESLQKQGGFIEGVRPGKQTENHLNKIVNRLNLFGSLTLGLIAIMPFMAEYVMYRVAGVVNSDLSIGGTGLLIVISVAIETLRQINSRALMVTYDQYK